MSERWLQIKGDPSIRAQLFEQQRVESLFDSNIDRVHEIAHALLVKKGVFHIKIAYSSCQFTCWFTRDPFVYEKYVREEVLEDNFLDRIEDADHDGRKILVGEHQLGNIFKEFKRLRLADETIYLRNAAVNLVNGMINISFSCDGTHYIDQETFFSEIKNFETPGS